MPFCRQILPNMGIWPKKKKCHFSKFGSIRSNNWEKMVIRCSRYVYVYIYIYMIMYIYICVYISADPCLALA